MDGSASAASGGVLAFAVIVGLASMAFSLFLYARVAHKAGYSPWTCLWQLVPVAGFVVTIIFVFSEWPLERENRIMRGMVGSAALDPYAVAPARSTSPQPAPAVPRPAGPSAGPLRAEYGAPPQEDVRY